MKTRETKMTFSEFKEECISLEYLVIELLRDNLGIDKSNEENAIRDLLFGDNGFFYSIETPDQNFRNKTISRVKYNDASVVDFYRNKNDVKIVEYIN